MHQLRVAAIVVITATTNLAAPAVGQSTLFQLPGTAGCVSENGTGGECADGKALDLVRGVALSPDGKNLYATALNSDAITIFDRNLVSGALTQKLGDPGCMSLTGTGALCSIGVALDLSLIHI